MLFAYATKKNSNLYFLALQCGENECYNPNGTSCPQPSCDNPNPETCNDVQSQPGCFCKDGFIRNSNKKCVPLKDCKGLPCGENEYYDPNGTSCPPASCDFPNPETCNDIQAQPGCFCKDGFIRNPKNKCVLIEDCKKFYCCPGNQTYVPCTFRCPQNVCPTDDWPMACKPPRNCQGGCGCPLGYRWNENDECIHASDCPEIPCTIPNTYWNSCTSPDLMEDCTNQQNQEDLPPPDICKPWCICQQGYFRDYSNSCVLPADCPP